MAEGSNAYKGLAVPLQGESEIQQLVVGNDILTLTGATSMTGDFIVCQNSSGTELFVVTAAGAITSGGAGYVDNAELQFGTGTDISIKWDGTDLDIVANLAGADVVKFGSAGTGLDMWFYGSQAGARMIWDEGKGQLLLNASAAVHSRLNMGTSSVAPTSTIAQGDLFIHRSGTTFRLGIASTGTTKAYTRRFDVTFGSAT